jgi:hypothetical protein
MEQKRLFAILSASFIVLSLFLFLTSRGLAQDAVTKGRETAATGSEGAPAAKAASPAHKIMVYYFHTTRRCPTCRKLEVYTREAVEKGFAEALKGGKVEFKVVNIDEPQNKHFVEDFKLYTKSVVLVDMVEGKQLRWKNLEKVWELVVNQPSFIAYIQDEINAYLVPISTSETGTI